MAVNPSGAASSAIDPTQIKRARPGLLAIALACAAKDTVVPDRRCAIVAAGVPTGRALAAAEWALAAALAGVRAGAALRALAGPLTACGVAGLNPLSPLR